MDYGPVTDDVVTGVLVEGNVFAASAIDRVLDLLFVVPCLLACQHGCYYCNCFVWCFFVVSGVTFVVLTHCNAVYLSQII